MKDLKEISTRLEIAKKNINERQIKNKLKGEVKKIEISPFELVSATRKCSSSCFPRTSASNIGTTGISSHFMARPIKPKKNMT